MKKSAGQALLIVVLSIAAASTIVLSVISRSIVDVKISTREVESQRAFSAAEAGVEKALSVGQDTSNPENFNGATFNTLISDYAKNSYTFVYPYTLTSNDAGTIWFISHNQNGEIISECDDSSEIPCFSGSTLKLCFGVPGTSAGLETTPAIEVSFYYTNTPFMYSTMKRSIATIDPNAARRSINFFSQNDAGNCVIDGKEFAFYRNINLGAGGLSIPLLEGNLQFARVRMFYNDSDKGGTAHGFGVEVIGDSLPSQGRLIDSIGNYGESERKVQVFDLYPDLPPVFDTALYSRGDLIK